MPESKKEKSLSDKNKGSGFTAEERAAMRARAKEMKAEARASEDRAEGERALQEAIAAMQESDRVMAERLHEIITSTAPELAPKTWYGMPAYANKEGRVVCFFQSGQKFKTRYATLGFQQDAHLDEGSMWPVAYALSALTSDEEHQIVTLVKKAVSPN